LTLIDGIYQEFSMLQIQSGNGLPKNPQKVPVIRRVKEVFHSLGLPVEIVAEKRTGMWGHPLKGTCQEKKIIHQQEIAFFSWERGGCENGPPSGSSEQPPTL
jgi:hypothetical protein